MDLSITSNTDILQLFIMGETTSEGQAFELLVPTECWGKKWERKE